MDPQLNLADLVEDLEVNIDELSTTLKPLLPPQTLSKTTTTLPLLEKAKLYTLAAYAIESTLFSSLLTSGADAKNHAIFKELSRLKGYFAKIKAAEEHFANLEAKEKRARLDVGAAQRFIKHGLSGNERYDEIGRERREGEKKRALEKARALTNKSFGEEGGEVGIKRGADGDVEGGGETPKKKMRVSGEEKEDEEEEEEDEEDEDEGVNEAYDESVETPASAPAKRGRKGKKTAEIEHDAEPMDVDDAVDTPQPAKKKRGRPSKKDKAAEATPQKDTPTRATRSSAPKTRSEAFQALAAGSPAGGAKGKGKSKKGKK